MEAGWNEEPCRCPRLRCARNGYRESGFADKSGHADAIDLWRVAISDVGLPDRLLANADTAGKEKHRRGAYWNHPVIGSVSPRVARVGFGQLVSGFNYVYWMVIALLRPFLRRSQGAR